MVRSRRPTNREVRLAVTSGTRFALSKVHLPLRVNREPRTKLFLECGKGSLSFVVPSLGDAPRMVGFLKGIFLNMGLSRPLFGFIHC